MPKWPDFDHFNQKWPILTKLTPLMTPLTKFMSINLSGIIFIIFREKIFDHFPKFLTYDVIFPPKWPPFWPKMSYFDQIDPINGIFDQTYVHKPDWNNFFKLLERNILPNFPKFWHMVLFRHPKWPNLGHFHQKWPILTKLTPLITLLTKFMSINMTEIIFKNF